MQLNGFLKNIFLSIANKLGFQLQSKVDTSNDFYEVNDVSMTSTIAENLSTMIIADSTIGIKGNRVDVLNDFLKEFSKLKLKPVTSVSLGTGDCLVVPVTNGKRFDVDIIENENFAIISAVGQTIYACVMQRDYFVKDNKVYRRFEYHGIEEVNGVSVCRIKRYAYIDDKEVSMTKIDEWANIPEETIIPNVEQLLLGRFRCPTLNRENINSPQGVPITYGLDIAVQRAKESYLRVGDEFRRKETKIFASKTLFRKNNQDDTVYLPNGADYVLVKSDLDSTNLPIKEFSPDLRSADLIAGSDYNLEMLELFAGFSNVLTKMQDVNLATATAIRASMNKTFAFIDTYRSIIEIGVNQLMYAVAMLYNANNQVPVGEYEVAYEWDQTMKENSMETYNQLLQSVSIGTTEDAELRAWQHNESIEVARERIKEIKEESVGSEIE